MLRVHLPHFHVLRATRSSWLLHWTEQREDAHHCKGSLNSSPLDPHAPDCYVSLTCLTLPPQVQLQLFFPPETSLFP